MLQGGACRPEVDTAREAWDRTVHIVARLPKHWTGQWLLATDSVYRGEPGYDCLTQQDGERLDSINPEFIPSLFQMMTGTSQSTSLPMEMRSDKALCATVCRKMQEELGSPMKGWKTRAWPKVAGHPNPLTAWAFRLVVDESNKVKEVVWYATPEEPLDAHIDVD